MIASSELQWYGKLPAAGDFVQRRMPPALNTRWSHWFQQGLIDRQHHLPAGDVPLSSGPVWNFVLPATLGVQKVQLGCLLLSRDRVGRTWPLLAQHSLTVCEWHPEQLDVAGQWFNALGATLLAAVNNATPADQLEQALQALAPLSRPAQDVRLAELESGDRPCRLAWQEVARRFDPLHYTSYWWTNQAGHAPLQTHRHSGNLTARLFTQLFHPTAGKRAGRHGFYPPMFD